MGVVSAACAYLGLAWTAHPIVPMRADARQADVHRLVTEYRTGDADAALRTLLHWSVEDLSTAFLPADAALWDHVALMALHTEAGLVKRTFGQHVHWLGAVSGASVYREPHYRWAVTLAEQAWARRAEDDRLALLLRDWYVLASSLLSGPGGRGGGRALEAWHRRFEQEAAAWLLAGSLLEWSIGPERRGGFLTYDPRHWNTEVLALDELGLTPASGRLVSTSHGNFNADLASHVERLLRRALDLDPALAEARARLGRLLYLMDRRREARDHLERAVSDARATGTAVPGYWAALHLGRLSWDLRQGDGAAQAYRDALAFVPEGRAARIGLAEVITAAGYEDEAWRLVGGPLLTSAAADGGDPWALYYQAQLWQSPALVRRLREAVRR